MHILGKILVWLLFPTAVVGLALMSRHLQIKNSYTKKLAALKSDVAQNQKALEEKEERASQLAAEYDRLMQHWQAYWDRPPKQPGDPPQKKRGTRTARANIEAGKRFLGLSVGTDDGVGTEITDAKAGVKVRKNQMLHVFRRRDPNQHDTVYVGRFELSADPAHILANSVRVYPDWNLRDVDWALIGVTELPRYRPGLSDDEKWRLMDGLGHVWRVRASVPEPFSRKFTAYYLDLSTLDRKKQYADTQLVQAQAALKEAEDEVRRLEIEIAGPDGSSGFVGRLRQAEDERNRVLAIVDDLRRQVKTMLDEREELRERNKMLVELLPSSSAKPQSPDGKARPPLPKTSKSAVPTPKAPKPDAPKADPGNAPALPPGANPNAGDDPPLPKGANTPPVPGGAKTPPRP